MKIRALMVKTSFTFKYFVPRVLILIQECFFFQGEYMYFENSLAYHGYGPLTKARLVSVEYPAPPSSISDKTSPFQNLCFLRFWYYIYGYSAHMGAFKVQIRVSTVRGRWKF